MSPKTPPILVPFEVITRQHHLLLTRFNFIRIPLLEQVLTLFNVRLMSLALSITNISYAVMATLSPMVPGPVAVPTMRNTLRARTALDSISAERLSWKGTGSVIRHHLIIRKTSSVSCVPRRCPGVGLSYVVTRPGICGRKNILRTIMVLTLWKIILFMNGVRQYRNRTTV